MARGWVLRHAYTLERRDWLDVIWHRRRDHPGAPEEGMHILGEQIVLIPQPDWRVPRVLSGVPALRQGIGKERGTRKGGKKGGEMEAGRWVTRGCAPPMAHHGNLRSSSDFSKSETSHQRHPNQWQHSRAMPRSLATASVPEFTNSSKFSRYLANLRMRASLASLARRNSRNMRLTRPTAESTDWDCEGEGEGES